MPSNDLDKLGCSPRPAFLWDVARRRVVWANAAAVRLFGALGPAELAERPFGPRDPGVRVLAEAYEQLRQSAHADDGSRPRTKLKLRFPSVGRDKAFSAEATPHPLADGREGLLVMARDLAAERAASGDMFSEILHDMPQPLLAFTPTGAPVFANPAAVELLGEDAALACAFATPSQLRDFLDRARQTGLAVTTREVQTPLGKRILRLVARAGRDDGLVVVGIDDLTDRLRLERMEAEGRLSPEMPRLSLPERDRPQDARSGLVDIAPPGEDREDGAEAESASSAPTAGGLEVEELATLKRIMQALEGVPPAATPSAAREEAGETAAEAPRETAPEPGKPIARDAGVSPAAGRVKIRIGTPELPAGERIDADTAPVARDGGEENRPATETEAAPQEAQATPPVTGETMAAPEASGEPPAAPDEMTTPEAEETGKEGTLATGRSSPREAPVMEAAEPESSIEQRPARPRVSIRVGKKTPEPSEPPSKVDGHGATSRDAGAMGPAPDILADEDARVRVAADDATRSPANDARNTEGVAPEEPAQPALEPAEVKEREEGADEEAPARQRPEPPAMVRDVLDHRPEPIILHRSGSFFYANRAARDLLGFSPDDEAWDDIARLLAESGDEAQVELTDARGDAHRFRLQRDIFPWRAGMVVQSTLLPPHMRERRRQASAKGAADRPESPARTPQASGSASGAAQAATPATNVERARSLTEGKHQAATPPSTTVARRAPAPVIRIHTERGIGEGPKAPPAGDGVEAALARATPAEEGNFTSVSMPAHVMHALLEMAADGIALLDTEGNIISFSAGAERLFGLSSEEARGRPFRDLLASESRPALEMHLKVLQAADAGHELRREQQCDVLALGKGGGKVPLCLILGRLPRNEEADDGKAGNVDARALFCVAMHDITRFRQRERELERAREEAERHSARKSEFLARISHELRTPLNAILGFAEVLRQEMFGELGHEKYRAYAHDIQKSGELLLSLVNDLLDLARIESGRYELRPEEVNLGAVLEDTVSLLRDQISATGVEVRRVVPDNLPKVVADARSMKQILINLLSNAIKFSGHNGRVVVALRQCPDGGLELAVKDSGPGMSREELREALEPFRRVSRTGEGKPGTGLGLPLAKALAEANKARLEIDSEPGQGTEVRVIFPPHRVLA